MRILTMVLFSAAAIVAPALVSAKPGQTPTAPAPTAQTASTKLPTVTITARAPQAPPAPAASTASDPDEIVCLMTPPRTGSRIGGARECHARRDWDRNRRESETILSGMQMRGLQGATR
ncbi:MAG TPA: hypothetical protein VNX86_18045 [Rhizomicrobium sp.]|nr:hypothetical protein [Rhizomicrobium sp.]